MIEQRMSNKLTWKDKLIPPAILTFISALFYYPSLNYPFQFDDIANITKNFHIRNFAPWRRLFKNRWMGEFLNRFNYKLGKFEPFYYRLTNLTIHILTGLTLFFFILLVCRNFKKENFLYKNSVLISFITSGIFLLHPVQTQAVSYVIQARLEGLACLFVLLALLCFAAIYTVKNSIAKAILIVTLPILGFLSCGTKEIVLISPLLLIITDWFLLSNQQWDTFKKRIWVHVLFTISVFGIFMYYVGVKWFTSIFGLKMISGNNRGNILTQNATDIIRPYDYFISEFKVILHYLLIFLWPLDLSVEYDWKLATGFFAPDAFFPLLALLGIGYFALYNAIKKRFAPLTFGLMWFFIAISPRSTIVPSPELICDYKTYLASVGWIFAISVGITYLINFISEQYRSAKKTDLTPKLLIGSMLTLTLAYGIVIGFIVWQVEYNLKTFAALLFVIPAALLYTTYYIVKNHKNKSLYSAQNKVLFSLLLLLPIGYGALNRNIVWSSPVEFWSDIVIKAPKKARGHNNYGVALSEQGKYHESIKHYKEAIRLDSNYCDPHSNLAVAYSMTGKTDKAIGALRNALHIFPNYPEAYNNLGSFLLQKKDHAGAEHCFNLAIKLRPWYGKAHLNLGRLYLEKKENEKAWDYFVKATTQADLDNIMGFTALGEVATKLQKYKEAINAYENAIALGSQDAKSIFNLANSYYMEKQMDKAVAIYHKLTVAYPDNPHYLYNLAETYYTLGNYNKALDVFTKVKELKNAVPQTHLRIANCFENLGSKEDAKKYYEMLTKADAPEWFKEQVNKELARLNGKATQAPSDVKKA